MLWLYLLWLYLLWLYLLWIYLLLPQREHGESVGVMLTTQYRMHAGTKVAGNGGSAGPISVRKAFSGMKARGLTVAQLFLLQLLTQSTGMHAAISDWSSAEFYAGQLSLTLGITLTLTLTLALALTLTLILRW